MNSSYVTLANTMLSDLQQYQGTWTYANWLRTVNGPSGTAQDFLGPVPEPATLTLLSLGALSTLFMRRRIRRRSA